jgi:hypothetical protein
MDFQSHYLFGRYLAYYSHRSMGEVHLYKISESNFHQFESRYLKDPQFQKRVNEIYNEVRNLKLDEILKKDL